MDVLSDVLRVASLGNALLSQSELSAPWGMEIGPKVRAAIHVVKRGVCWMWVPGSDAPVRLFAGDLVFIPGGAVHVLADDPKTRPLPFADQLEQQRERDRLGLAGGDRCALICAEITFDQKEAHPLMSVLPDVIHIPGEASDVDEALRAMTRVLVSEASSAHMGRELIVPRLIDTLVVLVVRHWLRSHPVVNAGWLGALRDPKIALALGLIHEEPQHSWTVEKLAARAAMSRASFARRFTALVGEPPLAYLTRWRLNVAAKQLKTSTDSIERIAFSVGYESPTSFGNAFRRHLSISPGKYRIGSLPTGKKA